MMRLRIGSEEFGLRTLVFELRSTPRFYNGRVGYAPMPRLASTLGQVTDNV